MDATTGTDVRRLIDGRPIGAGQWAIVALCALVALLDGLDLQAIGLAAPAMAAMLHVAPRDFGPVFSAALAGLALGAFALGPLADTVGRKRVLVGATLFFGVFTLLTPAAPSLGTLLLVRLLAGFGLGGALPSFVSLAADYVPARRRAAVVGLLWAGFPLGGVVGGLLGSVVIPSGGWRILFVAGGVAPLLLAVVLAAALPDSARFLLRADPSGARLARVLRRLFPDLARAGALPPGVRLFVPADVPAGASAGGAAVRLLFARGEAAATLLLWAAFFFAFMVLVTNSSWTPILLRDAGVPVARSAVALAAYNFGSLFGSAAAGWLVERLGPVRVLPATLAGGALCYALIGAAAPSVAAVTLCEALFGLLLGCGSSGLIALAAIHYPAQARSTGVGWATALGRFGSFSGPLAVGLLVGSGWSVRAVFAVVAAATVLGAVAVALMAAPGLRRPQSLAGV